MDVYLQIRNGRMLTHTMYPITIHLEQPHGCTAVIYVSNEQCRAYEVILKNYTWSHGDMFIPPYDRDDLYEMIDYWQDTFKSLIDSFEIGEWCEGDHEISDLSGRTAVPMLHGTVEMPQA